MLDKLDLFSRIIYQVEELLQLEGKGDVNKSKENF